MGCSSTTPNTQQPDNRMPSDNPKKKKEHIQHEDNKQLSKQETKQKPVQINLQIEIKGQDSNDNKSIEIKTILQEGLIHEIFDVETKKISFSKLVLHDGAKDLQQNRNKGYSSFPLKCMHIEFKEYVYIVGGFKKKYNSRIYYFSVDEKLIYKSTEQENLEVAVKNAGIIDKDDSLLIAGGDTLTQGNTDVTQLIKIIPAQEKQKKFEFRKHKLLNEKKSHVSLMKFNKDIYAFGGIMQNEMQNDEFTNMIEKDQNGETSSWEAIEIDFNLGKFPGGIQLNNNSTNNVLIIGGQTSYLLSIQENIKKIGCKEFRKLPIASNSEETKPEIFRDNIVKIINHQIWAFGKGKIFHFDGDWKEIQRKKPDLNERKKRIESNR